MPPGLALFVALCLVTLGAAAAVLHFKTGDLALQVDDTRLTCSFYPQQDEVAHIPFFVRYSDEHAVVSIVGEGLSPARVLAADTPLVANEKVTLTWDGRKDDGTRAPAGRYALRVNLPDRDRNMLWIAKRIHLDQPCPQPVHKK